MYARGLKPSNVGHFDLTITLKGWGKMSIGTSTQPCCDILTFQHTTSSGNWLHNSCQRQVSHWYPTYFVWHGECWHDTCPHHAPWRCMMYAIALWGRGRQGTHGGGALLYTRKYTDQENRVLTTLHIQWFTHTCDHILCVTVCYNKGIIVRIGVDIGHRMCKTTLVVS